MNKAESDSFGGKVRLLPQGLTKKKWQLIKLAKIIGNISKGLEVFVSIFHDKFKILSDMYSVQWSIDDSLKTI